MWLSLLLPLTLAATPSDRVVLGDAIKAYYDGGRSAAAVAFETLLLERPFDDDVAWWVARSRIDQGRHAEGLAALEGRNGRNLEPWRFTVLEATALVLLGDPVAAQVLVEAAWPQVGTTADRAAVAALLGLLRAGQGDQAGAAEVLRQAGPDPRASLDPVLRQTLIEAVVFDVKGAASGSLDLVRGDGPWRLDLATGLALRGPPTDPAGPAVWARTASPRGRADACPGPGTDQVWTSPEEALHSRQPGVYRVSGGSVVQLALTPPGAVDLSPACLGDQVWFVRRLGDHAEVLRLEGRAMASVATGPGAVATVDARRGRGGVPELVLGLVVDGRPGIWWLPAEGSEPQLLVVHDAPLLAPRWVD